MTAKEYFSELKLIKVKIEQLQEQKQMYLEMATSITASLNPVKVQSNSPVDRMGDNVVNAQCMDEKIQAETERLINTQEEMIRQINKLSNVHYIRLLFKVYIQEKTVKETANEMELSYPYVRDLHIKALKAFEKIHADKLEGCKQVMNVVGREVQKVYD